jgi:hypothetical protein
LIRIPINWRIPRHVVAALIPAFMLYLLQVDLIELTRFYHVIFAAIAGGIVYGLLLIAFGELTRKEWGMFLDTVDVRKMLRYIKGEVFKR